MTRSPTCQSGHALKTGGRSDDAVAAYRAALDSQPFYCDAWYSLANLKVYRFDDAELAAMEALENNPHLGGQDRVYLQFALGKAYEDRKDYAQSFTHYAKGNAIKKAQLQYRAEGTTQGVRRTDRRLHTRDLRARNGLSGPRSDFYPRTSPRRVNLARADFVLTQHGGWHLGTAQRTVDQR